jgi:hypothetical protein
VLAVVAEPAVGVPPRREEDRRLIDEEPGTRSSTKRNQQGRHRDRKADQWQNT